jgi:hypothetical protein
VLRAFDRPGPGAVGQAIIERVSKFRLVQLVSRVRKRPPNGGGLTQDLCCAARLNRGNRQGCFADLAADDFTFIGRSHRDIRRVMPIMIETPQIVAESLQAIPRVVAKPHAAEMRPPDVKVLQ